MMHREHQDVEIRHHPLEPADQPYDLALAHNRRNPPYFFEHRDLRLDRIGSA